MFRVVRLTFSVVIVAAAALALGDYGAATAESAGCSTAPAGPSLELVYRLEGGREGVTPSTRDEAMAVICERLRRLAGVDGEVRALDDEQIRVLLPRIRGERERRAIAQIGATGQLYFYDWESNLIGPERTIGGRPGRQPPAGVLSKAKRQWRAAGRDVDALENLQLILAGALPTARDAIRLAAALKPRVAAPTRIVSERPVDRRGRVDETARPGWFVLKDRPALTGSDIVNVQQGFGEFNEPNVTFGFTDEGRVAFQRVTRAIARRGQARALGPVSGSQVEGLSGHLALVLDGDVKTRPIINFALNPQGIDGRTGAQISGGFRNVREARDLATILAIGALPVDLALVRQQPR